MLTALGTIAIAFLYVVGCSVCRTAKPYDDAATECERDREWWRGLEAPGPDGEVRDVNS